MFTNPVFKISALLSFILIITATVITITTTGNSSPQSQVNAAVSKTAYLPSFVAAIDTQIASEDNETTLPYTKAQIDSIVTTAKTLGINYLTVDTNWDYQTYLTSWVQAIHNHGLHVWLKSSPVNWTQGKQLTTNLNFYLNESNTFLQQNSNLFQQGDIIDLFPDPSEHWSAIKQQSIIHAIADYNNFLIDVSMQIYDLLGSSHVVNAIHTQDYQTGHNPLLFYPNTASILGAVSIDTLSSSQQIAHDMADLTATYTQPILLTDANESLHLVPDIAGKQQLFKSELSNLLMQKQLIGYCYVLQASNPADIDPVKKFFYVNSNGISSFNPYLNILHDFFQEALIVHS